MNNMRSGLAAGLAMAAAMGGGMMGLRPGHEERENFRARVKRLLVTNSAHTPKPEIMFASMLDDASAKLIRRHGKQPLLRMATPEEICHHKEAR